MPIPAYAPIWNAEENRVEYLGPRTYPDLPVARAVRMAVALPLFIESLELVGRYGRDGGIVDILPVRPVLDIEERPDVALAINGFDPPGFAEEDASGWKEREAAPSTSPARSVTTSRSSLHGPPDPSPARGRSPHDRAR